MTERDAKPGLAELIAVAHGDAPGDLLFTNGRVVNTLTAEIEELDVVVFAGRIAGLGGGYRARETVDLRGAYLLPGFINGHTHIESSHLWLTEYARAIVPHGTVAVVSDLHEIANVAGLAGIHAVVEAAAGLPLDLHLMVPACVPATSLETAGATIGPDEIRRLFESEGAIGLGELMDFPGAIAADPRVLNKLTAAGNRPVDGHAPGLSGAALNAYLCAGPRTDHESTTLDEAHEKLRRGMWLMVREGTTEKNLADLLPLITDATASRCLFVTDDRSAADLLSDGDVDAIVRKAIALGLDPIRAVQLATLNPATCFGLRGVGAVAPGYRAHLLVCDDLHRPVPRRVYFDGRLVAEDGVALFDAPAAVPAGLLRTVEVDALTVDDLALPAVGPRFPVIEAIPGQILTGRRLEEVRVVEGRIIAELERDILKLAVVERHHGSGRVGVGLVSGFGLKRGALASSYAHDSHNIIAVGASDENMLFAVHQVVEMQGGLVVVDEGEVLAALPLPAAGIVSLAAAANVSERATALDAAARSLGATIPEPFAVLSFLSLPVIPSLRLTDMGLVDAKKGQLVDLTSLDVES
ncbi:MAG: adenine deaminase [Dehalococcoidia bacterium]